MKAEWEKVYDANTRELDVTDRLRVPGGWLYRTTVSTDEFGSAPIEVVMVFVPEAELFEM
jgi:hypothetical protein